MSGFFNATNKGRVAAMVSMIEGPMARSARSNKATPAQWGEMLEPLTSIIRVITASAPEKEVPVAVEIPTPTATSSKNPPGSIAAFIEGLDKFQLMDVIYQTTAALDAALVKEEEK